MECGYPKLDGQDCMQEATASGFCKAHSRKKMFENLQPFQVEKLKKRPNPEPKPKKAYVPTGTPRGRRPGTPSSPTPSPKPGEIVISPTLKNKVVDLTSPINDLKLLERLSNFRTALASARTYAKMLNRAAEEIKNSKITKSKTIAYSSLEAFLKESVQLISFMENQGVLFNSQITDVIYGSSPHNVIHMENKKPPTNHLELSEVDLNDFSDIIPKNESEEEVA